MDRNPFSNQPVASDNFEVLQFSTNTGLSLIEVIPSLGGAINRLQLTNEKSRQEEVICPISPEEFANGNPYYKGVLLFPFVNRLDNGKYSYAGKSYQFALNEPALRNRLHGFLFNLPVNVNATYPTPNETRITLQYSYTGNLEAYPFPMGIEVEYCLHDINGLTVTFNITNNHQSNAPLAIGWHPYFTLRGSLANWQMQLPTVRHISVDKRLLPTGHKYHYEHFNKLNAIGNKNLDHCFQLDLNQEVKNSIASSYLWSEEYQHGLEIWQQVGINAFNYLQVCIPPIRDCVAIEPVSANINAFNNGEGLTHLEPNKTFTQQCGVRLISKKPKK